MNVYGCLEWIDRGHGNIKDNKSFFTILFTADYTEPQRMMKYLITTILLLEIFNIASSMILPSDDVDSTDINNWSPLRKNYVLKNYMSKRAPAAFWVTL